MDFLRKLLWKIRRAIILLLIFTLIASALYIFFVLKARSQESKFSAIIDSDSGNGVTDLIAISRALADPRFKVIALTSTQWNQHPQGIENSVGLSQVLNDELLKAFKKEDIPHPMGENKMISYQNESESSRSAAAEFIVKEALKASKTNKLNIVTLGAMTNLATALVLDSTIASNLRVFAYALYYDTHTKIWNKNEFNVRNDLDALDLVLNTENLELHIMPVSVSKELVFGKEETADLMKNRGAPWDFLINLWQTKSAKKNELAMSDVALIEAILKPDLVKEEETVTPPENRHRHVFVYTSVNKEFMKIDFWDAVNKYISDNN